MKMQKYYERDHFTYEEKTAIAKKSDDCCCHCGRKVYFNYGATVDHFIPLDKGGSNSKINLIMLCNECNQEKDNKLMTIDYIPYLKDTYKKELEEYVESYVQVMDIAQRNRLLAYDEYTVPITTGSSDYCGHNNKKKNISVSKFKIKLATWNDLDKLNDYFIKYLKKYDSLDNEQAARENIIFWMQFGCIYYIERNDEINMMIAMTIKNVTPDEGFKGSTYLPYLYLFPYYTTNLSCSIASCLVVSIPRYIMEESNLDFIPINILMLDKDKMTSKLAMTYGNASEDDVNGFTCMRYIIGDTDGKNDILDESDMSESDLKTFKFLQKFEDVTNNMITYFEKYSDRTEISWMITGITSYPMIKETSLMKYFEHTLIKRED